MTVTVLDSTDLPGILADAGVTLDPSPETPSTEVVKAEVEATGKTAATPPADDEEDENGLTAAEREGITDRMRKAIGKRHREKKEAEEFAAVQYNERRLAEQRALNLEQELATLKARVTPEKTVDTTPTQPQRQNFASEADYVDAMIQYGVDKRLAEKAEEDRQARMQRERDQLIEAAKGRISRAIELVPDYAEVTGAVDIEVPPAIAGYMQKSEMFAELGYHLAKNPDLLVSLAKLPPDEQLVKIGKIESTLSPFGSAATAQNDSTSSNAAPNGKGAKPAPSKDTDIDLSKPRSKAAPVITPLDAGGAAGASKDSKDMNIREAIEDFSKRNRLNLNQRKRH